MRPGFEFLLEGYRLIDPCKLRNMDEAERSTIEGITIRINPERMLVDATLDIVRHPNIKRSVKAA